MLAPIAGLDASNKSMMKSSMGLMSDGMAVAMYTTLAGLVGSIQLKIQYCMLDNATAKVVSRGNGQGGTAEATAREVTPSTITTTGGGDPSSGGPVDPQSAHGENQTINFTPLAPPRMPPKDAR